MLLALQVSLSPDFFFFNCLVWVHKTLFYPSGFGYLLNQLWEDSVLNWVRRTWHGAQSSLIILPDPAPSLGGQGNPPSWSRTTQQLRVISEHVQNNIPSWASLSFWEDPASFRLVLIPLPSTLCVKRGRVKWWGQRRLDDLVVWGLHCDPRVGGGLQGPTTTSQSCCEGWPT